MSDRRIVVSIDFGTTYSGIAWSETSRVSNLKNIFFSRVWTER